MKYLNVTPKWQEILPIWQTIVRSSVNVSQRKGVDGQANMRRFWDEMNNMAQAADYYNALIAYLRRSDTLNWDDEMFQNAIVIGNKLQEADRNTVKEVSDETL